MEKALPKGGHFQPDRFHVLAKIPDIEMWMTGQRYVNGLVIILNGLIKRNFREHGYLFKYYPGPEAISIVFTLTCFKLIWFLWIAPIRTHLYPKTQPTCYIYYRV